MIPIKFAPFVFGFALTVLSATAVATQEKVPCERLGETACGHRQRTDGDCYVEQPAGRCRTKSAEAPAPSEPSGEEPSEESSDKS